jgi:hypothetical protein
MYVDGQLEPQPLHTDTNKQFSGCRRDGVPYHTVFQGVANITERP